MHVLNLIRHTLVVLPLVKLQAVAQSVAQHAREQGHLQRQEDVHDLLEESPRLEAAHLVQWMCYASPCRSISSLSGTAEGPWRPALAAREGRCQSSSEGSF